MRFGYLTGNHIDGIHPGDLARELEDRNFDSVWFPEHSHIPTEQLTPYPNGGQLPGSYVHMMDPWVSVATAAAVTSRIQLATGVCLLLEHDVLDLACTVATADALSDGRVTMGIGVGWNKEELENHRPDLPFPKRYSAMRERVQALRTAWANEEAEFSGVWDNYSSSWVYPKPTNGTVPIALGNAGPLGIQHAAEYADEWCPIDVGIMNTDGKPDVIGGINRFTELADKAGRDGEAIPISLYIWGQPQMERLEQYANAGVTQFVFTPVNFDLPSSDETLTYIDQLTEVIATFNGSN